MKLKLYTWFYRFINKIKNIQFFEDTTPIGNRYTPQYYLFLNEHICDIREKDNKRNIVYAGKTVLVPPYLKDVVKDDINPDTPSMNEYVIVFDNWNKK